MIRRHLPWALALLAVLVWIGPLQWGWYDDVVISDLPVYQAAADRMRDGMLPYRDFDLEYPPLAALLFLLADVLPGGYAAVFSGLMCSALVATVLGVVATARALGMDQRRQVVAGAAVALSPLFLGSLVETRFDLVLAALMSWMVWAVVSDRWRLAWAIFAVAVLTKLIPLALLPVLVIFQRHRHGTQAAVRGAGAGLGALAVLLAPLAAIAPDGLWHVASYHLERPLQVESTGAAYMLGLHALADIPLRVENSFGSQGLVGDGPDVVALILTVLLALAVLAIAATFAHLLRRARPPGDARLATAAIAATTAALLAGGKVLSPQFLVWLLPACLLVAGRYGWPALGTTMLAMALTQAYFPRRYWDLVALSDGVIGILVLRDLVLVVLVAMLWPRPGVAQTPAGVLPTRRTPAPATAAERAVAARFLTD